MDSLELQKPKLLKTAVVTGATGFLGSYLVCHLVSQNYRVLCTYRSSNRTLFESVSTLKNITSEHIEWRQATLEDPELLASVFKGADVVFHWRQRHSRRIGTIN